MNKMGIIKAKGVVHEFFRRDEEGNVESITTALDHVDLDVKAGQFIAILGHNGSGKSTLAKHINALLTPNEGTLWVDGMDVLDEENTIPVRKTAGMVFQNPDNQIIASVVEEDVGFGPENIGVPTDEIWERETDGERVLVAVNIDEQPYHAHFDARCGRAVDLITGEMHDFGGGSTLEPYSCHFWKCER